MAFLLNRKAFLVMKKHILYLAFIALAVTAHAQTPFKLTSKGTQYRIFTSNTGTKVKLDDIITHRLPLSEIAHGYSIFKKKEEDCVKVVLDPWK